MSKALEFSGFGCSGGNRSPQLLWQDPPEGTQNFAVTVCDPDAPKGSGFWHWLVTNISKEVRELAGNFGAEGGTFLPENAHTFCNYYGQQAFGGACPVEGNGAHRYQFKVWALSVRNIELPSNASAALVGFMLHNICIG